MFASQALPLVPFHFPVAGAAVVNAVIRKKAQ
jgi:hypothetical protein